ncbi:MAG: prohibitin family protein [Bacteroidales bacterium]|nr:prohibitin family protein [Bacteroidales bacterium]
MANSKNTYTPYEEVNNSPRRSKGNGTFLARPAFWITIGCFIAALITLNASCTVIDSGEIGIKFHKWSANEQDYGGVEGTCKGWVFYNPITTSVFSYPTYIQRKNYEAFNVNAKDASVFSMDPTIAYRINPEKACDIFTKYRKGIEDLENGYIRTCIYEAYRTCANQYTSDSLMSNRANFERDVRSRLESSLMDEGFIVEEFTSQITPPQSLAQMINEKNAAVQSALKAENKVKEAEAEAKIRIAEAKGAAEAMQIKADAEAYYNRTIAASLSPLIVQEDWIEKWNGTVPTVMSGQNMMLDMSSIIGKK